jgi:alkyl hydroperoxide reductase subunit AhpF
LFDFLFAGMELPGAESVRTLNLDDVFVKIGLLPNSEVHYGK